MPVGSSNYTTHFRTRNLFIRPGTFRNGSSRCELTSGATIRGSSQARGLWLTERKISKIERDGDTKISSSGYIYISLSTQDTTRGAKPTRSTTREYDPSSRGERIDSWKSISLNRMRPGSAYVRFWTERCRRGRFPTKLRKRPLAYAPAGGTGWLRAQRSGARGPCAIPSPTPPVFLCSHEGALAMREVERADEVLDWRPETFPGK